MTSLLHLGSCYRGSLTLWPVTGWHSLFLSKAGWWFSICFYHIYFIPSPSKGCLGSSHLLAIVDKAALNMSIQIPRQDPAFSSFGCVPKVGLLDLSAYIFSKLGSSSTID